MSIALAVLRFIWGFLTSKAGVIFLVCVVLAGAEWKVYDLGVAHGAAEANDKALTKIQAIQSQKDQIQSQYSALQASVAEFKRSVVEANEAAKTANASIVADLQKKLAASSAQVSKLKTQLKELPKYVTPKADSECVVTSGFVSVYNAAVKASPIPDSAIGTVDAPSGIAISHVADVTAANLAECVERGKIIDAWQEWYQRNKTAYDQATEKVK